MTFVNTRHVLLFALSSFPPPQRRRKTQFSRIQCNVTNKRTFWIKCKSIPLPYCFNYNIVFCKPEYCVEYCLKTRVLLPSTGQNVLSYNMFPLFRREIGIFKQQQLMNQKLFLLENVILMPKHVVWLEMFNFLGR